MRFLLIRAVLSVPPNGSRLKLRATRPLAQESLDVSPCPTGHSTPFPLERSPPASFKRLLGCCVIGHELNQAQEGAEALSYELLLSCHSVNQQVYGYFSHHSAPRRV